MAALVTNQGLQRCGRNTSAVGVAPLTNLNTADWLQTLSVDNSATALAAATTTCGSPTSFWDQSLDATPTISGQTVTHVSTIPTGQGNFTIARAILHFGTPTTVTGASATVHSGVDGQSLGKTLDFSLAFTITHLYSNVA